MLWAILEVRHWLLQGLSTNYLQHAVLRLTSINWARDMVLGLQRTAAIIFSGMTSVSLDNAILFVLVRRQFFGMFPGERAVSYVP